MAETTERTVIIKLNFDVNDFTKQAVTLNKEIEDLNKKQKELVKQGQGSSLAFQQNKEKLQSYSTQLRETNKVIQNLTIANKSAAGSNEQLKAQLSILTLEYNGLSKSERETTVRGKELQAQVKAISDTLKENEGAVGNDTRKVGGYSEALKELKQDLKDARGELVFIAKQFGETSPQYIEAAKRAGELDNRLKDINESIKASSGEPLERLGQDVKLLKDKVLSLDFKGISTQLGSLAQTVKGISFKSLTSGADGVGASLKNLAVSILKNPIFILAAVVIGVSKALYDMVSAANLVDVQTKTVTESIEAQKKSLGEYSDRVAETYIKINQALGLFSKTQADIKTAELKNNRELINSKEKYGDDLKKLAEELGVDLTELENGRLSEMYTGDYEALQNKKRFNLEKAKLDALYSRELIQATRAQFLETKAIEISDSQERAKIAQDKIKKLREDIAKEKEERLKATIDANKALLKQIQDQEVELIKDEETRAKAREVLANSRAVQEIVTSKASNDIKHKALEDQQKTHELNLIRITDEFSAKRKTSFDKAVDDQIKADKPRIDALTKSEEDLEEAARQRIANSLDESLKAMDEEVLAAKAKADALKQIEKASFDAKSTLVSSVFAIKNNERQSEINESQRSTQVQIDNIQRLADTGIITQQEFETKSNRIKLDAQKKEAAIKRKQFESQKTASLIQVGINTAEGVANALTVKPAYLAAVQVGFALATGVAQAAVINSAPTPAFADSGKVLSGKKIGMGDGRKISRPNGDNILATVRAGEVVLNERHQAMLGGDSTFRKMGVPGFANSGFVDGGTFSQSVSTPVEQQISATKIAQDVVRSMPPIIVIPKQVNDVLQNELEVEARADI